MFNLNDELVSPEEQFANLKDDESKPLLDNTSSFVLEHDEDEDTLNKQEFDTDDFDD